MNRKTEKPVPKTLKSNLKKDLNNKDRLKLLMVTSEAVPFIKSGGLADVAGSLSSALSELGHEVCVVLPKYGSLDLSGHNLELFHSPMEVWMGNTTHFCSVYRTRTEEGVTFFFIEFNIYFERDGIYHDRDFRDYEDNPRRFAFLSNAALKLCRDINFRPDIVHTHDWQAAPAAAYLKIWYGADKFFSRTAGILTIHNIGHQGVYPGDHYEYTGLGWDNFTPDKFEDHGKINFLKGGIHYADMVNTVSPGYAWETRSTELGSGMQPFLNAKGSRYTGILNGADYSHWNPENDPLIPAPYSSGDLSGKAECKKQLQKEMMLRVDPDKPVIGVVGRFVHQKGMDILAEASGGILRDMEVQLVVLGAGDKGLEHFFGELPRRFPGKAGSYIGYSERLAHLIEAGSDFFLMPSRYEPCGLNQIYSMKYGTLPIVRATGGLNDTVDQYDESSGEGTGFKFWEFSSGALYYTVGWAVSTYYDRKTHINRLIQNAMSKDYSWNREARSYVKLYRKALGEKSG